MAKKKYSVGLIASIVFASVVVGASLLFLGYQFGGGSNANLEEKIDERIDVYVQNLINPPPPVVEGDFADDDAILGGKNAPVTIVEFSDYECPFCKRFHDETLPLIKEKYIDTGKASFVYRDLPIESHKKAYPSALAAECVRDQAGDDAYFAMHDLIFNDWYTVSDGTKSGFLKLAKGLNLDEAKFSKCFDDDKFKSEIANDASAASSIQISGTPGFVINGTIVTGAQPFSVFEEAIDAALANVK